jgi:hypothetical protein
MNNIMNEEESNQDLIYSLRYAHKRIYTEIIEEIDKVIETSHNAIDKFGEIAKEDSKNYYDNIELEFNELNLEVEDLNISIDKTKEIK